jgi:hypothetical protein
MTVRAFVAAFLVAGCELPPVPHVSMNPGVPDMATGMATLSGTVVGADGAPVAGATVKVRETGTMAVSGPDGSYSVVVPGDTSVRLEVTSMGNATTLSGVVLVPGSNTSMGYQLLVLPQARVDAINMAGGGVPKSTGVVALRVGSVSGRCHQDGATATFTPSYAGKLLYAAAGTGVTDPDPNGSAIPADVKISAWLTSVTPPSVYDRVTVSKADCPAAPLPAKVDGRVFSGLFSVQPQGLTLLDVFME